MKISDEELVGVKDDNSDIQLSKEMEFCLLHFDRDVLDNAGAIGPGKTPLGLWEWQANCTGNCMMYLIDYPSVCTSQREQTMQMGGKCPAVWMSVSEGTERGVCI